MMSLYVALEDIQLFAGRAGEEEARRIYPQVRQWTQNSESRKAIWHAGQVFHHANKFEKTRLRDFYAVALYHATLVIWVWGMITFGTSRHSGLVTPIAANLPQSPSLQGISNISKRQVRVMLDGTESKTTKAFIHLGHGIPGLQNVVNSTTGTSANTLNSAMGSFCSLFDSRAIMSTAAGVLKGNFPQTKGSLPPLVDNLTSLINELGKLPT